MNILLIHNYYQENGGEDVVVENEKTMLEKHGHRVIPYFVYNDETRTYNLMQKTLFFPRALYNGRSIRKIAAILETEEIDIVHIHNFWPIVSPSVFFYLNRKGIPYVQTVHNYRYIVANAVLYWDDVRIDVSSNLTISVRPRGFRSYRRSFLLTLLYWLISRFVRWTGVIDKGCGSLIVLNEFSHKVHSRFFSRDKLYIKGNFCATGSVKPTRNVREGGYYLYLGRISHEKGIDILIEAYLRYIRHTSGSVIPLKVAGEGSLLGPLKEKYREYDSILFLGYVSGQEKYQLISQARALVLPSRWHEPFGLVVMEAYLHGVPVIAANVGGLAEMVVSGNSLTDGSNPNVERHVERYIRKKGCTGFLFEPGNTSDLATTLDWCEKHPAGLKQMGINAQRFAGERYGEEQNYYQLMHIYQEVINQTELRQKEVFISA